MPSCGGAVGWSWWDWQPRWARAPAAPRPECGPHRPARGPASPSRAPAATNACGSSLTEASEGGCVSDHPPTSATLDGGARRTQGPPSAHSCADLTGMRDLLPPSSALAVSGADSPVATGTVEKPPLLSGVGACPVPPVRHGARSLRDLCRQHATASVVTVGDRRRFGVVHLFRRRPHRGQLPPPPCPFAVGSVTPRPMPNSRRSPGNCRPGPDSTGACAIVVSFFDLSDLGSPTPPPSSPAASGRRIAVGSVRSLAPPSGARAIVGTTKAMSTCPP